MNPSSTPKVVVLGDTRDLHHHGCEAVLAELCAGLTRAGLPPQHVLAGLQWRDAGDGVCETADVVVINGEGSLHHDRPHVAGVLALAALRKVRGKTTVLLNASWFANAPERSRELEQFSRVAVRESASAGQILRDGGPAVSMVPDLAIAHALRSGLRHTGGGRIMVSDSTKEERTKSLRRLARVRGWEYLPALAFPAVARAGAKSRKIFRRARLAARLGPFAPWLCGPRYHAHAVGAAATGDYLARLAASGGVVTGRFHTVCFAMAMGVPFVAVASNTPKIEAIITDAGLDVAKRVASMEDLDAMREVPPYDEAERAALMAYGKRVLEAEDALFAAIANDARSGGEAEFFLDARKAEQAGGE